MPRMYINDMERTGIMYYCHKSLPTTDFCWFQKVRWSRRLRLAQTMTALIKVNFFVNVLIIVDAYIIYSKVNSKVDDQDNVQETK